MWLLRWFEFDMASGAEPDVRLNLRMGLTRIRDVVAECGIARGIADYIAWLQDNPVRGKISIGALIHQIPVGASARFTATPFFVVAALES